VAHILAAAPGYPVEEGLSYGKGLVEVSLPIGFANQRWDLVKELGSCLAQLQVSGDGSIADRHQAVVEQLNVESVQLIHGYRFFLQRRGQASRGGIPSGNAIS
jgi:hypothetical protein